jgi:hypothetical protein
MWSGLRNRFAVALMMGLMVAGFAPAGAAQPAPRNEARASQDADDAHRRQDIERHRQMAAAHGAAAACLESGQSEKACQETLREACKGIAVGRYCGMRHAH